MGKSESNGSYEDGAIKVLFDIAGQRIQVWVYDSTKGWVQNGKDIPARFADGDRFRALLREDGVLEIYRDGKLLSEEKLSSLPQQNVSMVSIPEPVAYNVQATPISLSSASFQNISYHPSKVSAALPPKPALSAPQGAVEGLPLPNLALQQPTSLTIDYSYDALHRLTSATYSDGRNFAYTYDPAGNVLELQKNLGPGTVVTTYSYDTANQLQTAQENGVTWQYHYDANGSLIETLPDGNAASGAKRYTYNVAGYLMKVEAHNGTDWETQAEMDYNG